jgi:hypothetical protein
MTGRKKQETISFKVDKDLATALDGIANRSEFIRSAVLTALENSCPLCRGTGILTPDQHRHWTSFSRSHSIEKCDVCKAVHIVCVAGENGVRHP